MIHYISYFLDSNEILDRKLEVAAQSKIKYIINSIKNAGFEIKVVSTTFASEKCVLSRSKRVFIDNQENHIYFAALGSKNILTKKFRSLFMQIQLFFYLINEVKKDDQVIFYHALNYITVLKVAKKIKKMNYVIEFNDLYALHFSKKSKSLAIERKEKLILSDVDAYILASPYMTELIDVNKPYIVSYGSYETVKNKVKRDASKIYVAYTGIIENSRNAAFLVAKAALFLTEEYEIHIAGFGNDKNTENLKSLVDSINKEKGYIAVKYHGLLLGYDFEVLLQKCSIGLNAHSYIKEDVWKSKYSFPSKIPLNMSYDLYLVSSDIDVVRNSPFVEFVDFFEDFSPQCIANAIERCTLRIEENKVKERTPSDLIQKLDQQFVKDIRKILNNK